MPTGYIIYRYRRKGHKSSSDGMTANVTG